MAARLTRKVLDVCDIYATIWKCRGMVTSASKVLTKTSCRTFQSKSMNSTFSSLEIVRHMQELALLYPQTGMSVVQVEDHQVTAIQKALDIVGTLLEVELDGTDPLYALPSATHLRCDDVAALSEEEWELLTGNSQCHKEGCFVTAPIPAADRQER